MREVATFPLEVWGEVLAGPVRAVRIERSAGSSFLILTREGDRVFDTWVESAAEVESFLATLRVVWPGTCGP